jgi:hypothetical protein
VAADAVGIASARHYEWLRDDPDYKERFEAADKLALDRMLSEARRRGLDGWEEPVVYQGQLCYPVGKDGKPSKQPLTIRKYSDNLLMFIIKGKLPEFRDSWKAELKHSGSIANPNPEVDLSKLSDEQLQQLEDLLQVARVTPADGLFNGRTDREIT